MSLMDILLHFLSSPHHFLVPVDICHYKILTVLLVQELPLLISMNPQIAIPMITLLASLSCVVFCAVEILCSVVHVPSSDFLIFLEGSVIRLKIVIFFPFWENELFPFLQNLKLFKALLDLKL